MPVRPLPTPHCRATQKGAMFSPSHSHTHLSRYHRPRLIVKGSRCASCNVVLCMCVFGLGVLQARSEPFEVRGPSLLASPMPASMTLATFSHEAARAVATVSPPRIVVEFHTCPLHTKFDWLGISRPGELPNQGITSGCVCVSVCELRWRWFLMLVCLGLWVGYCVYLAFVVCGDGYVLLGHLPLPPLVWGVGHLS